MTYVLAEQRDRDVVAAFAATGQRRELRSLTITIRLLGAYHDDYIELVYPDVYSYDLAGMHVGRGHGDLQYDEFRVGEQGRVIHEIEWASIHQTSRWVIEASDVVYRWTPMECGDGS